jgi:hypothetical protein
MAKDIADYVRGCDNCQRVKPPNTKPSGRMDSEIVEGPGLAVSVDFIGPLVKSPRGHQYALVVQDDFSKFVEIYSVRQATAQCAVEKMCDYVCRYGFPERIRQIMLWYSLASYGNHYDNGWVFVIVSQLPTVHWGTAW